MLAGVEAPPVLQASAWATRKSREFKEYVRRVGEFGHLGSLPGGGSAGGGGDGGGARSGGVREEVVELEECGCTRTLLVQGTRSQGGGPPNLHPKRVNRVNYRLS